MKELLKKFTLFLICACFTSTAFVFFYMKPAFPSVLCNPAVESDCIPLIEYMNLKSGTQTETALPVVIGYVKNFARQITLKSSYPSLADLENDLDSQVINLLSNATLDDEYLSFIRETGEVFNEFRINYNVKINSSIPDIPDNATYVYRGIILPSGSLIILRRVVYGGSSIPTLDFSSVMSKQIEETEASDTSPVILYTGVDFWKDYFSYYQNRKSKGLPVKSPLEYFREDWKKLPRKVRNVSLPPIFLIKNGKIIAMRGKTVYGSGEFSEDHLKRIKTTEEWNWYLKDKDGNVIDSFEYPAGTDLWTIYQAYLEEYAKEDRNEHKVAFLSRAIAKTLLQTDSRVVKFFNFDLGCAYLVEEDGVHTYAIVYAGTPKVLQYKAENDVHYTQYGMDDPTKIYWNEPLRNAIVTPERIACLYYAKENCRRFTVYKPASEHGATDETLRFYYREWQKEAKKLGVYLAGIDGRDKEAVARAIRKAMWSEKLEEVSFYTFLEADKLKKALQEAVEKPLVLSSRSYAEENYILTCNTSQNIPEALFKIPEAVKKYAEKTGLILKEENGIAVYFDRKTRLPMPQLTCEQLEEVAAKERRPVFKLKTTLPPPEDLIKEVKTYENYPPALRKVLKKTITN